MKTFVLLSHFRDGYAETCASIHFVKKHKFKGVFRGVLSRCCLCVCFDLIRS